MSTRALLVAIPFLAACMALAPAEADDDSEKLVTAAQAAICGPEYKDLSVNGHDFNVKEASVGMSPWDDTTAVVAGQISHRLAVVSDDQVYYTINYKDGVPDAPNIRIDRGGVAAILDIITDAIVFAGLNSIEIAGNKRTLSPEKLPEIATELSKLIHGSGWEDQAAAMIAFIGIAATQPVDEVCAMDVPDRPDPGTGCFITCN